MKAQRLGDVLLKSRPSPLFSFLAPSLSTSAWTSTTVQTIISLNRLEEPVRRRCLATSTSSLQSPSTAAAQKPEDDESGASTRAAPQPKRGRQTLDSLLDNFGLPPKPSSDSPPVYNSPSQLNANRRPSDQLVRLARARDMSSGDHLRVRQGSITDGMKFSREEESVMDRNTQSLVSREGMDNMIKVKPLMPPVRLDAFVGRSEDVNPLRGMDLGTAIRRLEIKCAYNNVRRDFQKQRFHERPGLKRKRLKSERWRKRFKVGFKAVVLKVKKMRKQGW